MRIESPDRIHPGILAIQRELDKIDRLRILPGC